MANVTNIVTALAPAQSSQVKRPANSNKPIRPNYAHIHRNALPLEVHQLPTLIPHNPLSLLAIALSYLAQVLNAPPRKIFTAYFSSATSSVHVTDPATQRALWEMGFFGRGNLSRSEPTWLATQLRVGRTAEENTNRRRRERRQMKTERAKKEQEEIEALLAQQGSADFDGANERKSTQPPAEDESLVTTEQLSDASPTARTAAASAVGSESWKRAQETKGLPTPPTTSVSSDSLADDGDARKSPKQKSVRFSPTTEAREFDLMAPVDASVKASTSEFAESADVPGAIENKEHLQLSMEEAFFLSYALGVLTVVDHNSVAYSTDQLLTLFRQHSHKPTLTTSMTLSPGDPFLLSYVVYHHFRSMGWVVRSGIKFGVDYLLYNRGPAFSHAEFAIVVMPEYSTSQLRGLKDGGSRVEERRNRTWWWLHGINRVQSHVHKHLILCYVQVPASLPEMQAIGSLLSQYTVREVNLKRWSPNRSRD